MPSAADHFRYREKKHSKNAADLRLEKAERALDNARKELAAEATRKCTGVTTARLPSAQLKLAEPERQRSPATSHAAENEAAIRKTQMESNEQAAVRNETTSVCPAKSENLADQSNYVLTDNYVDSAGKKSIRKSTT